MKVSFITSSWLDRDGYGSVLSSFVDNFQRKGWDVVVYHDDNAQVGLTSGLVRVSTLSKLLDVGMSDSEEFLFQSDIVFIAYLTYYPLMEISRFISSGRVVFLYPGITPYHLYPEWDPLREFTRQSLCHLGLLKYGDAVVVNSQYMLSELAELAGLPEELIKVLPLTVHSATGNTVQPRRLGRKFAAPVSGRVVSDGPVLLYVGRITGNKRVGSLLKGIAILKETFPAVTLFIAGMHQRVFSVRYMEELQSLIDELAINGNVIFKSDVASEELHKLYSAADLFVTASLHEGFCLPVAEALSLALPSVVPGVTATSETMGEGGLTYEAENMVEFAEVVSRLLTDDSLYEEISQKALKESLRFTSQSFNINLNSMVEEILSSNQPHGDTSPLAHKRCKGRINLCDCKSHHHTEYKDPISIPFIGPLVKWLRRKLTFPVEKSVIRPVVEQQSLWNKLMVEEVRELSDKIRALEKRDYGNHSQADEVSGSLVKDVSHSSEDSCPDTK